MTFELVENDTSSRTGDLRPVTRARSHFRGTWRPSPPALGRADCTFCQGTGWQLLREDLPRARRCSCGQLGRLLRLKEQVGLPERYGACTLETYLPGTPSQARAKGEALRYVARYPNVPRGLMFSGGPGVGKTHLAAGIVRALIERFHDDILFVDFDTVLRFQLPMGPRTPLQDRAWLRVKRVKLLVVDDVRLSGASDDVLVLTADLRTARAAGKRLTIYTGENLRQVPPRAGSLVESRMLDSLASRVRIIPVQGEDLRKRGAPEGLFSGRGRLHTV